MTDAADMRALAIACAMYEQQATANAATAAECEADLYTFVRAAFHVIEPEQRFVDGWHIKILCEHLEAATRGEIRNILFTMPPRTMKSLVVSVFWPAWVWLKDPSKRFLFASYGHNLAMRDSVYCRRLIQSAWYQQQWSHKYRLVEDQNTKTRYETDVGGFRFATSPGGMATGEGGDFIVADDPHNVKKAESDNERKMVIDWWRSVMTTRVRNPQTAVRVIVQQRVHVNDLAGDVLTRGGYAHVNLPMHYDPERTTCTTLGAVDHRTTPGTLLWPEHIPEAVAQDWARDLGPYQASAQLEQAPTLRAGGVFKREWFQIIDASEVPCVFDSVVRYWDCASTPDTGVGDPDFTAGCKIGCADGVFYVLDMRRGRWSPHGVEQAMAQAAVSDGMHVPVHIEQEPGASGKSFVSNVARTVLPSCAVTARRPSGSKRDRAMVPAAKAEMLLVYVLRAAWTDDFLDELCSFPGGAHDDQVDAFEGAIDACVSRQPIVIAIG